jgi:hypothetical protein
MVAFNKYNIFVQDVGRAVHNLHTGVIKVALTNTAPSASAHAVKADITEIGAGNGYSAGGGTVANSSYVQTAGVAKLAGDDVVFTAAGGTIGAFRYAVLYNDTPTSPADPLIGWWDYGSSITLQDGDSFTVDISDNTQVINIT